MIGESLLATQGGHFAAWLRAEHPEMVPLYQPEAALDGRSPDLDEAWTCAVPAVLPYNRWIAERAVSFLKRPPAIPAARLAARSASSVHSAAALGGPVRRGARAPAGASSGRARQAHAARLGAPGVGVDR